MLRGKGARDSPRPLHRDVRSQLALVRGLANGNANRLIVLHRLARMIGLAVRREVALADVVAIAAHRVGNDFADVGVLAREFGRLVEGETEQIVDDKDLAVAVGAGADADGGDAQLAGDLRGELAW